MLQVNMKLNKRSPSSHRQADVEDLDSDLRKKLLARRERSNSIDLLTKPQEPRERVRSGSIGTSAPSSSQPVKETTTNAFIKQASLDAGMAAPKPRPRVAPKPLKPEPENELAVKLNAQFNRIQCKDSKDGQSHEPQGGQ